MELLDKPPLDPKAAGLKLLVDLCSVHPVQMLQLELLEFGYLSQLLPVKVINLASCGPFVTTNEGFRV